MSGRPDCSLLQIDLQQQQQQQQPSRETENYNLQVVSPSKLRPVAAAAAGGGGGGGGGGGAAAGDASEQMLVAIERQLASVSIENAPAPPPLRAAPLKSLSGIHLKPPHVWRVTCGV